MPAVAPVPAPAEPPWGRFPGAAVKLRARRWWLVALVLAVALATVSALRFTGGPVRAHGVPAGTAAATRGQAAAWIAGQVSSGVMVACDPGLCSALEARGVNPGRLVLLRRPAAARQLAAGVVVAFTSSSGTSVSGSSISARQAAELAPALVASFGSGRARVEVRATVSGGAAAYAAASRADLAARRAAGAQLLRNGRLRFTARGAAGLRAGEVDARLLATLAGMSSRYPLRVTAFGETSPGARVLFREVTVEPGGRGAAAAELTAALAMVSGQEPPYRPAHAAIIRTAAGTAALRIEFAAPSPLGLLTPVLVLDPQ
jgi:hypothetical protein